MIAADRCHRCDRAECRLATLTGEAWTRAIIDCAEHAVDWRPRAIAAETWRAKVEPLIEDLRVAMESRRGRTAAIGALLAATEPKEQRSKADG